MDLYANDWSTVNLFGGEVLRVHAGDSSTVYMYGGCIDQTLGLGGSSVASLFGGKIAADVGISGSAMLKIYGYGFEFQRAGPTGRTGWLSGYWLDGTSFSRMYLRNLPEPFPGSQVVLIPEPGALLLLALGSLGLRKRSFLR